MDGLDVAGKVWPVEAKSSIIDIVCLLGAFDHVEDGGAIDFLAVEGDDDAPDYSIDLRPMHSGDAGEAALQFSGKPLGTMAPRCSDLNVSLAVAKPVTAMSAAGPGAQRGAIGALNTWSPIARP